jgi:hypothetical protein
MLIWTLVFPRHGRNLEMCEWIASPARRMGDVRGIYWSRSGNTSPRCRSFADTAPGTSPIRVIARKRRRNHIHPFEARPVRSNKRVDCESSLLKDRNGAVTRQLVDPSMA